MKIKSFMEKIQLLLLFSVFLIMPSCSLKYDTDEQENARNPEFVFRYANFSRYEDGKIKMFMEAEKLEQYKEDNSMFGRNIQFSTYNDESEPESTGSCRLLEVNNNDEIYNLYNDIKIFNTKENLEIHAQNLQWNSNTEQLISGVDDKVTLSRDDLSIEGTGFSASGISKSFVFNNKVSGTIITKEGESEDVSEDEK